MIELPESYVLAEQINEAVAGRIIRNVTLGASPHSFAWYNGSESEYQAKLEGRRVTGANPGTGYTCGGNTEILCEDSLLVFSTPLKYHGIGDKLPQKHQFLLEFDDGSHLSATVQMWGAMLCFAVKGQEIVFPEGYTVNKTPSPLTEAFDRPYFDNLLKQVESSPKMSTKAFLATEQRIPGLGNGVLQDILFLARIHPKTPVLSLDGPQLDALYGSVKSTLLDMALKGGRDTERDLHGCPGGYGTILSAKTLDKPCPVCGGVLERKAYLGGNIYFCGNCQPQKRLDK